MSKRIGSQHGVSKNNRASGVRGDEEGNILNKDGSIRKKSGRKAKNAREAAVDGHRSQEEQHLDEEEGGEQTREEGGEELRLWQERLATLEREHKEQMEKVEKEKREESERVEKERKELMEQVEKHKRDHADKMEKERNDFIIELEARGEIGERNKEREREQIRREILKELEERKKIEEEAQAKQNEQVSEQLKIFKDQLFKTQLDSGTEPKKFSGDDICGFKMKLVKFNGTEDEDYDVWWEDLQAFFQLYPFTEAAKIKMYNAHLGGEARKFIQNEDLSKLDTLDKLHQLLRGTFSDKYDWQNVLMNIRQRQEEKIRPFSVRLRVAARKCGMQGDILDNMCVNYLKKSCAPYLSALLNNCLPNTPYDQIVEHAIQYERRQELEKLERNDKKPLKKKIEEIDITEEKGECDNKKLKLAHVELEKQKIDFGNTLKQIKDSFNSRLNSQQETINSLTIRSQSNSNNCQPPVRNSYTPQYTRKTPYPTSKPSNACLHCAKPNHRFYDCRSASEIEKNNIRDLLRDKKFDFRKHQEKADSFAQQKKDKFGSANSLNSETPSQQE